VIGNSPPHSMISTKQTSIMKRKIFGIPRNRSVLYYGFVPLGESQVLDHKLVNYSGEQLRVQCSLHSASEIFKIVSVSKVIVQPNEELVISIRFAPNSLALFGNILMIERTNGDGQKYSFKLVGYGGRSDLRLVDSLYKNGTAIVTPSGAVVLTPDFFPPPPSLGSVRCGFELVNKGDRTAFVSIVAVDKFSREIPTQQVLVTPNHFTIEGNEKMTRRISIRINERSHNTSIVKEHNNSAIQSPNVDCCRFSLIITWAEEIQRQRFKAWKANRTEGYLINGQNFTEPFAFEEKSAILAETPFEHECDEFKNSLRIIKMNVVDSRAIYLFGQGVWSQKSLF